MYFGSFLLHICTAVLAGYLSFADYVGNVLFDNLVRVGVFVEIPIPAPIAMNLPLEQDDRSEREPTPISITSDYEYGGDIPKILLENSTSQPATLISTGSSSLDSTASDIEDALVNIYCTLKTKKVTRTTTGSGVFVSGKGVILTNAHVAQFLLLEDADTSIKTTCVVRTGSPAKTEFVAKLLYIPPLWISANAKELQNEHPQGTGERDYALLYVTESTTGTAIPTNFPYVSADTQPLTDRAKLQKLLVGGYPAEKLLVEGPRADLPQVVATTSILDFYTYGGKQADLMSIAPSTVGEHGASGGPVLSEKGTLIGLVSTKGNSTRDGERSLRALTLAYINRTILEETNSDLKTTLQSDLDARAKLFKDSLGGVLSWFITEQLKL